MFAVKSRRVMSTLQWSWSRNEYQYSLHVSTRKSVLQEVCYAEVLFQSSFYSGTSTRCLQNVRHQTRGWWYGLGTKHDTHHGTWHWDWARVHETWHSASLDSRLYHVTHVLIVSHPLLSSRVARTSRRSLSTRTSRNYDRYFSIMIDIFQSCYFCVIHDGHGFRFILSFFFGRV